MLILTGCDTTSEEFAVSNVPVYRAENIDELFTDETNITMKFANSRRTFIVGQVKSGRLTFALPTNFEEEFFEDPEYLTVYNVTPGLNMVSFVSNPGLDLYNPSDKQIYSLIYATKKGSITSGGIKYSLKKGWNLVSRDGNTLNTSTVQRAPNINGSVIPTYLPMTI
jgi:hypothetical protein